MKKLISAFLIAFIGVALISCDIDDLASTDSTSETTTSTSDSSSDDTSDSSSDDTSDDTDDGTSDDTNDIYSGDYYDSIDTVDGDILKTELNTLVSDCTTISYSEATTALKTTDSYDGNYVECLYTGQRLDPENVGSTSGSWNKEHVWAKTYGFNDSSYAAYSDINHLRVTEASINSNRGSKYFGEVSSTDTGYSSDDYGNSWSSDVFDPRDDVKGDIARILLYMTVRYNDSTTLDLELTDDTSEIEASAGQLGGTAYLGVLSTLLEWAADDPVDSREISRNNAIYSIQGNRNPFIDNPQYAYYIYEDECDSLGLTYDDFYDNGTYTSYDSDAIDAVNTLIDAIGTVSLDSGDAIDAANDAYDALDDESKSFVTGYATLQQAIYDYGVLEDAASRDTTVGTSFDLTTLTGSSGSISSNGVSVDYTCSLANSGKGIYSQTSTGIELDVSNLYDSLSAVSFTLHSNKGSLTSVITITDGTNSVSETETITTSSTSYSFDLSSLDLSSDLTITITNETGHSVILSEMDFSV